MEDTKKPVEEEALESKIIPELENEISPSKQKNKKEYTFTFKKLILMIAIVSFVVSGISIYTYDRFYVPKIVAIDFKGYLQNQRELWVSGKITEAQLKQNLDVLEAFVEKIPKKNIVLMADAVIRNIEVMQIPDSNQDKMNK